MLGQLADSVNKMHLSLEKILQVKIPEERSATGPTRKVASSATCYTCGGRGHLSKVCPTLRPAGERCHWCGKTNHTTTQCRRKTKTSGKPVGPRNHPSSRGPLTDHSGGATLQTQPLALGDSLGDTDSPDPILLPPYNPNVTYFLL